MMCERLLFRCLQRGYPVLAEVCTAGDSALLRWLAAVDVPFTEPKLRRRGIGGTYFLLPVSRCLEN